MADLERNSCFRQREDHGRRHYKRWILDRGKRTPRHRLIAPFLPPRALAAHLGGMTIHIPRQPQGIPAGGQFAATSHTEPEAGLHPEDSIGERLAEVNAALAVNRSHWSAEQERLRQEDLEHTLRRRRLAGVRSAAMILKHLPEADVLSYTRTPVLGTTTLDEIRAVNDNVIYSADDLDNPASRGHYLFHEAAERRAAVREAVRLLAGTEPPPEYDAQGITVHSNHERLHLATALDDGLGFLQAEELTPQQASAERITAALSQWSETNDDPQTTMRDLLTDLRHHAAANNLDLGKAMDGSYQVFLGEHHDPVFKEGF